MQQMKMLNNLVVIACVVCVARAAVGLEEFELDRCTSIGAGRKAMADGSTIATHNNDCQECDIRVTHVPAMDWPAGSRRPIYDIRAAYPRYVQNSDLNNYGPDYLQSSTYPDRTISSWNISAPMMYIDQVPHTFAYTLGLYGIQNEKQVSIGESTCGAKLVANPLSAGGRAAMKMETLTELALERCDSARCAIKLMGDMGTRYGFYGGDNSPDEAGESLTVSDPEESWIFHILPDDTGASAVWVAQRIPDDHIAVVANQFVIGEIDLNNKVDFLASSNIFEVARRAGLWQVDKEPFNFLRVYGTNRFKSGFYCTRRVWRVFTLAAPSLLSTFSPFTDGLGSFGFGEDGTQPYPFSVKPDKPLTLQDIFQMNRDQYEGTQFDLTAGPGAGPFGDPTRYMYLSKTINPVDGVTVEQFRGGLGYERGISLFRTAYSSVAQARSNVPDLGAVSWIAQYAPHHSSFVPIYAAVGPAPTSLNSGTQYKLDHTSNFWSHCVVSNWVSRFYRQTISDVRELQLSIEKSIFDEQRQVEEQALRDVSVSSADLLLQFQQRVGSETREKWWEFFYAMLSKYRDLYAVSNPHAENFKNALTFHGVPRWWLEQIGYWGAPGSKSSEETSAVGIFPLAYQSLPDPETYASIYPSGKPQPYAWISNEEFEQLDSENKELFNEYRTLVMSSLLAAGGSVLLSFLINICLFGNRKKGTEYVEIRG